MYAILETGGKQYRVEQGDTIYVEKLPYEELEIVELDQKSLQLAKTMESLSASLMWTVQP